jgi:integrase
MPKLTLKTVKALPVTGKDIIHWDDENGRFGLRITARGAKSYLIQYRNAQGRSRRLTIGSHGVWTPDLARDEAAKLLRRVDEGGDPAESKREDRAAITVSQLCDEYMRSAQKSIVTSRSGKPKKASTLNQDASRISAHIKPLLGDKPVKDLTQAQVRRFFEDVVSGKSARIELTGNKLRKSIVEGGVTAAKRCVGLLGGMMAYAVLHGYRQEGLNPAHGIGMPADKRRQFRLDPEGWRKLGKTIDAAEAAAEPWQAVGIARLLSLTGCRLEEIASLRWHEVDVIGRCLKFEDGRVKSGQLRPIGQAALDLLHKIKTGPGASGRSSGYVFPGWRAGDKPYRGFHKAWTRMGMKYSPHHLRHAFASTAEDDCEHHESTVGALLGHSKGGNVTRGYIRKADATLLAAADKVSDFIAHAMKGEAQNVIPFEAQKGRKAS